MSETQTPSLTTPDIALERRTVRHVIRHVVPFLGVLYLVNFLDRTNVSFAALTMNGDIGISARTYSLGAGIFFWGYFAAEIPSNFCLHKFGPRRWIAVIMIAWGVIATGMGLIRTPTQFVTLRVLLGLAEAGFFPGIIFVLSNWIPRAYRARTIATFYLGVPISQVIGAPLSVSLIDIGNHIGLSGWRLMYFAEGVPALLLGIACVFYLTDSPSQARWLDNDERGWLVEAMAAEERGKLLPGGKQLSKGEQIMRAVANPYVWAFAFIYFGITSGSNAMNFFLPSVLQSFRHAFAMNIGLIMNGLITAVPYAVAAVTMLFWTRRSDRRQERRMHTAVPAMLAAVSIAASLLIDKPLIIVLGFILLAAGGYSAINVFWAMPQQLLTGLEAATAIALVNSIGNLSGFTGPIITGYLYTITGGYKAGFLVIAVFVFLGGLGAMLVPKRQVEGVG